VIHDRRSSGHFSIGRVPESWIASPWRRSISISLEHVERHDTLAFVHHDSLDRLLVAQAMIEKLLLVSADAVLDENRIRHVR
jgi:PIN domain nuclease of toxin-antitoxin system